MPAPCTNNSYNQHIPNGKNEIDFKTKIIQRFEPEVEQLSETQLYEESKLNVDANKMSQYFQNKRNIHNKSNADDIKHAEKCNEPQTYDGITEFQFGLGLVTDTKTFVDKFFT